MCVEIIQQNSFSVSQEWQRHFELFKPNNTCAIFDSDGEWPRTNITTDLRNINIYKGIPSRYKTCKKCALTISETTREKKKSSIESKANHKKNCWNRIKSVWMHSDLASFCWYFLLRYFLFFFAQNVSAIIPINRRLNGNIRSEFGPRVRCMTFCRSNHSHCTFLGKQTSKDEKKAYAHTARRKLFALHLNVMCSVKLLFRVSTNFVTEKKKHTPIEHTTKTNRWWREQGKEIAGNIEKNLKNSREKKGDRKSV